MSKQDRTYTRTASALEQKYDFSLLGKSGGGGDSIKVSQLEQTLSQYMATTNGELADINEQLEKSSVDVQDAIDELANKKVDKTIEYYGDMNKLVTSGFYRVGTNANLHELLYYGQVIVSRGSDTASQIGISYHTGKVITRSCNSPDNNPNWTEWIEYATKQELENIEVGGGFDLSYEAENEALTLLSSSEKQSVWNKLSEKTGETGTITLPTAFEELHIKIGIDSYWYTFSILADDLTNATQLFRNGYSISSTVFGDVYVSVSKSKIEAWSVRKEGVVKEATIKVYYK